MDINIIDTKTVPTIQIQMNDKICVFHSKYNPIKESEDWVRNVLKLADLDKELIVIGLAAGYHIEALSRIAIETNITVLEFNSKYYDWFKNSPFYKRLERLPNIDIYDISNLDDNKREDIFGNLHSNNILIQKSALEIFPVEYSEVKELLISIYLQKNSFKNQLEGIERNFYRNIALDDKGINNWKNYYENKPMLLISAGPSLDKQLPLLKKIHDKQKIIIASVGTAVKPLLKQGIIPDFMMITDPSSGTLPQLQEVYIPSTPLFYLSTAYHETVVLHNGPRYIVFQEGYDKAEKMAVINGDPLIKTGGSVATTLLDLIVYMGASAVGLVGQDLAFTDGVTHAKFTPQQQVVFGNLGSKRVLDYYQNKEVFTSNNLNIYRRWFENYSLKNQIVQLYNCTEGGAFIKGWQHISLLDFYKQFE